MIAIRLMPERNCRGCTKQVQWGCTAKPYVVMDPETSSPVLGHDGKPKVAWTNPAHMPLDFDGEETYACPRQPLREEPEMWSRVFTYYRLYKKGFLPQTGAAMDQANIAVEIFRILDDANDDADDALQKAEAAKQQH